MATATVSREASKPEVYVQRKFAELCTRVQRVELLSHLLMLGLIVVGYACLIGWFDYIVGATSAQRWIGFAGFVSLFGVFFVQAIRMGFRRVNPYYVARQLERHLPESKNSLINWLDLHDDQLPSAFQKNLSARAAEQLRDGNPELAIRQRKHWILLGITSVPMLGLFVLFVLGPAAFFASMLQAFAPFYVPSSAARTEIALLEPQGGDAEVNPVDAVAFVARIDGRVPTGNRPDAPKLHYRYQASEDFLTLPLQRDADGKWTTQLSAMQLRSGFSYKITAGDVATPLHQITVRGRLHATKFDVTYRDRSYRKIKTPPQSFNSRPHIHGMRGTEVELVVRANRAVQSAKIELLSNGVKKDFATRQLANDKRAFACSWTLEQNAQFRILFNSMDGEANADREWYPIDVHNDAAPTVVLTSPGKDITLPENGTLTLEGRVSDDVGIKSMTLHLRVAEEPSLVPIPYPLDDGDEPREIEYMEVVALDQLKNAKGTTILLRAGLTIEYWLEATDNSDYPHPKGNIGKSSVYKIILTQAAKDDITKKVQKSIRDNAVNQKQEHDKSQKQTKEPNPDSGEPKAKDPQKKAEELAKGSESTEQKIENALNQEKNGATKSADSKSGTKKDSPPPEPDSPPPLGKPQTPMSPNDAGNNKDQGDAKNKSGESKDSGGEQKKNNDSKGERKNGPMDNPSSAKGDGPNKMDERPGSSKNADMDTPPQPMPKSNMGDMGTPMPNAKGSTPPSNEPQHGEPKGIEQNGPEIDNKSKGMEANTPPEGHAKSSNMNDAGARKDEPKQGDGDPGQARDNEPRGDSKNPGLRDLGKMVEQLSKDDPAADKIAAKIADIAKNAEDPRVKDLAKDILDKNGRDAKTGQIKKGPNRFGSRGKSEGISDEVQSTIANREFAARIGQMQLDDWKKQLTPDLLKRAGLTDADWQRFLKNRAAYDALVRQLNAKLIRDNVKDLRANGNTRPSVSPTAVQKVAPNGPRLDAGNTISPPELIEAERRGFNPQKP